MHMRMRSNLFILDLNVEGPNPPTPADMSQLVHSTEMPFGC